MVDAGPSGRRGPHEFAVSDSTPASHRPASASTTVSSADASPSISGYALLELLGAGGMGRVWRARQLSVGREVALKLLDPQLAREASFAERFAREARAAASVHHPNVVACFDAGSCDGRYYVALELVEGGDAAALARDQGGRLAIADATAIALDCARGLEAVALAGLIHRDIKPANIFLTRAPGQGGVAKLGDFGLARPSGGEARVTHTGAALGTPAYMAPEQARGERGIDIRADIYSLGASLFELLTGEPPYGGATAYAVVSQVLHGPVPDPRRLNAAISPALAAVVKRAMARTPGERYANPTLLREDLERIVRGEIPYAFRDSLAGNLSAGIFAGRPVPGDSASVGSTSRSLRRPGPDPWRILLLGVLLIGSGGGILWLVAGPGAASVPSASQLDAPAPTAPPALPRQRMPMRSHSSISTVGRSFRRRPQTPRSRPGAPCYTQPVQPPSPQLLACRHPGPPCAKGHARCSAASSEAAGASAGRACRRWPASAARHCCADAAPAATCCAGRSGHAAGFAAASA